MTTRKPETEYDKIAHSLLNYLANNPRASDSLKGITEWWLLKDKIDHAVEEVNHALEMLVSKELIIEKQFHAQRKVYQLNAAKAEEIERILDDFGPEQ